jgi:hypothetical protein
MGIKWKPYADTIDNAESFISWMSSTTADKIKGFIEEAKLKDWIVEQRKRKWEWAGHCARRDDNRWTRRMLDFQLKSQRPRGRPKARWQYDIMKFVEHIELVEKGETWIELSQSRDVWKSLCDSFTSYDVI